MTPENSRQLPSNYIVQNVVCREPRVPVRPRVTRGRGMPTVGREQQIKNVLLNRSVKRRSVK